MTGREYEFPTYPLFGMFFLFEAFQQSIHDYLIADLTWVTSGMAYQRRFWTIFLREGERELAR